MSDEKSTLEVLLLTEEMLNLVQDLEAPEKIFIFAELRREHEERELLKEIYESEGG